jgi:signal transduction histidine kinase
MAEEAMRRSEKIAATGRLAAAIAHEINNPLAAVVNALYLLQTAVKDNPEAALQYVRTAQTEIDRVSHITRQTLAFYRDTDQPEAVDVGELIRELMDVYAGKARVEGVALDRREESTAAVDAIAIWQGADVVRVHDVARQAPAIRVAAAVAGCAGTRRVP